MAKARKTIKVKIHNPNKGKEEALQSTVDILNSLLAAYVDLTLENRCLLTKTKEIVSKKTGEIRVRTLTNQEILTEIEKLSVKTKAHPEVEIDIKEKYPALPTEFRRSTINTSTGMCKSYLSNLSAFKNQNKRNRAKNPPAPPTPQNLPTFYKGTYEIELIDIMNQFVRLKVYHKGEWVFINYPIKIGSKQLSILQSGKWDILSPTLVRKKRKGKIEGEWASSFTWYLHIPVEKKVKVQPIAKQKKENPNLTTLSIDMGLRHLAVITVRKNKKIVFVKFFRSEKIESHRLRHLKKIFSKQKKSGKPVKGERSNRQLWKHIGEMNLALAHKISSEIVDIAVKYGIDVIIIEYLRKLGKFDTATPADRNRKREKRSRKFNRKFTYWLKGKLEFNLRYKALEHGILVKSVNPAFTSRICNKCGGFGERFSHNSLFRCFYCGYVANADFNASVNLHKVFWDTFPLPTKRKKRKKPTRKGKVAHGGVS